MKITTSQGDFLLLPFEPKTPMKEKLEWLTDIFLTDDDTELRTQKRSMPRQTLEYKIPLVFWKKLDLVNTVKGGILEKWMIPLWNETQFVGNIVDNQVDIICDTVEDYQLNVGDFVFIKNESFQYQWGEIESTSAISITLTASLNEMNNCTIMPMKQSNIVGDITHITNGLDSDVQCEFLIQDDTSLALETPFQFEDEDIYGSGIFDSGTNNRKIAHPSFVIDGELGVINIINKSENHNYTQKNAFLLEGVSQVREFKNFLYRRSGKFKAFWFSTSENDIAHKSTGLILSTMLIERNSIDDFMLSRGALEIKTIDGSKIPVRILNINVVDSTTLQLNLDRTLDIDASDIILISYLTFSRLISDSIVLNWIGNSVVKSNVSFIESNLPNSELIVN